MKDKKQNKWMVPTACVALVAAMVGISYASVPLYDWFCRVTGYGGSLNTAQVQAYDPAMISEREVTIRFDANVGEGVAMRFKPQQISMPLHIGETALANYISENTSDDTFYGLATFNVTPHRAATYVEKIECFCFSQHKLEPGEETLMPLTFYIDPAIEEDAEMDDIHTITFSYTFFETAPWSNETEKDS